jgi:PAS domain S-box-containing protein
MEALKDTIKLLENSSFYYTLIIGMDNRYTYVSPNYNRNFDFLKESLTGKPFYITLHPDDIKICQQVGERCFSNPDKLLPATLRKHDGKGGFVFTQWELKAVFDDNNQPLGIFGIGYNITDHVVTSSKLDDAIAELEDKNDKLNEIGFVQSHVVRKPLANIMGLAHVLTNMEVDHNLAGITNMMVESAHELDDAVKNIVDKVDDNDSQNLSG